MNRTWKCLQNLKKNERSKLHRAFFQYEVAVSFTGGGWHYPSLMGFGVLQWADTPDELNSPENPDFIFGHLAYEKGRMDANSADRFKLSGFFIPKIVLRKEGTQWSAGYVNESDFSEFMDILNSADDEQNHEHHSIELKPVTGREEYLRQCNSLLNHIQRGDIYEINYCLDFIGKSYSLDPAGVFEKLNVLSDAPMSVLYRNGNSWLMCASPERFISRTGNKFISQPIKGTIRRGKDADEDAALREKLFNDPKERSENVMIVDLVRNDLSRIATKGSVKVSELFGIHTFRTVHQMISTVECEVKPGTSFNEIIAATFPMGSMTGAPKISAMDLAEKHEAQPRGIYSGTVGFILPDGDFDFNVVIRSITWNSSTGHVSAKAGGAITANSIPEKEYEECLLKAKAMMSALNSNFSKVDHSAKES